MLKDHTLARKVVVIAIGGAAFLFFAGAVLGVFHS